MTSLGTSIGAVIMAITELSERPIRDASSLAAWKEDALRLQLQLRRDPPLAARIPHFIWQYLADADIRARDTEYASSQETKLKEALFQLARENAV
ncbi:MAG: hypothetical protein ACM3SO_09660 [Betaproteobacteria bacterium]